MIAELIDTLLLAFLVLTALYVALSRDLLAVIMVFSANSLLAAGMFMVMDAPDVGFTEAADGAGVSTILMLLALRYCPRHEQPGRRQWLPLIVVVVTGAVLVYGTMDLPPVGEPGNPIHLHVAPRYLQESGREIGVPNVVTSVLASYRGSDVDDVQEQVRLHHFFESGLERLDEPVGQLADETHCIGEQHVLVRAQPQSARRGIECGKELVFGEDLRAGKLVQQSGLAGIGIAHNGSQGPMVALARVTLGGTLTAYDLQVAGDPRNAVLHAAAVGFELGFAFSASHADAAFLPGQMAPESREPRQQMLELSQFNLHLAFARAGKGIRTMCLSVSTGSPIHQTGTFRQRGQRRC